LDPGKVTPWYKHNPQLFELERADLAKACPLMGLSVVGPGYRINTALSLKVETAVAHGTYSIQVPNTNRTMDYRIALVTPPDYPDRPPMMFGDDPKLPMCEIDRHILPNCCVCLRVKAEIKMRWKRGSNLVDFLANLVEPFLVWQAYYDDHGEAPPWGARPHGKPGIFQFYEELWENPLPEDLDVEGFIALLARKEKPKGHEICPCGSGKKLRICHPSLVADIWEQLEQIDVQSDLKVVRFDAKKSA
jgi:hypothetical protein